MTVLLVIAAVTVLWTLVALLCLALCRSAAAGDRSSPYLAAVPPPPEFVAVHDPVPAYEEHDARRRRPPARAALAPLDGGQSIDGGEVAGMAELEQALAVRRRQASRSSSP